MQLFRVFKSDNLLDQTFARIDRAHVISWRKETKGLGAATIEIDLEHTSPGDIFDNTVPSLAVNNWVFIQQVSLASSNTNGDIPDVDGTTDTSICWWGFISSISEEQGKQFKTVKRTLTCYEFGHFINTQRITYPFAFENGFNPFLDGVLVGNRNEEDNLRYIDLGVRPLEQASTHYWSVQQAAQFIVQYACNIGLDISWGDITIDNTPFLSMIENIPSYENETLTQAFEDLLDPLDWYYVFTSQGAVTIKIIQRGFAAATPKSLIVPASSALVNVLREEQKYDGIKLEGDRVLVSFSISTYVPQSSYLGIKKGWANGITPVYKYIAPEGTPSKYQVRLDELYDLVIQEIAPDNPEDLEDVQKKQVETYINGVLETFQTARAEDTNTYQHFNWGYGSWDLSESGPFLLTTIRPGKVTSDFDEEKIPVFPELSFQDFGAITINDAVRSVPILLTGNTHKTPVPTEMKFEDFIPLENYDVPDTTVVGAVNKYIAPTFFFKYNTESKDVNGEIHWIPGWMNGTKQYSGGASAQMDISWNGIDIKHTYPEFLACPAEDIYTDLYSTSDYTTVIDYGFQRSEWKDDTTPRGPSLWDPYLGANTLQYLGHWGRVVFSLSAYSAQRVAIQYGDLSSDRVYYERNENFKVWLLRRGLVARTKATELLPSGEQASYPDIVNALDFLEQDKFARNDMVEMRSYFRELWNFYNRDKRAVRVEDRILDENGKMTDYNISLGDFIKEIKDGSGTIPTNSFIASIEYYCAGTSPRVIISTEYPASPAKTRKRQVRSTI